VAAADAPVVFAGQYPESAELLLTVRRKELVDADLPDEIASQISELDRLLIGLMIRLAVTCGIERMHSPSTRLPPASSTYRPPVCCKENVLAARQHGRICAPRSRSSGRRTAFRERE